MCKTGPSYHLSHRAAIGRHPEARSELSEAWQSVVGHKFRKNSARKVDAWEITDFGLRAHEFCAVSGSRIVHEGGRAKCAVGPWWIG